MTRRAVPSSDTDSLRSQLGDANWATRLAEAREREELVRAVLAATDLGRTFAEAAREHAPHIGAESLRRWVERWQAEGTNGLIDRRRGAPRSEVAAPAAQLSFDALHASAATAQAPSRRAGSGRRAGLVKWSGSKEAVVESLMAMAPARFGRYHEPFVGGGSLFFAMHASASFLSDLNAELINVYTVVRDEPERLLEALARHRNTREHFLEVRGVHPDTLAPVERAARTLFLNRTCFNGIYRVNQKGIFNVPYGNMPDQGFFVPDAIRRAHRALAGAAIACEDFGRCGDRARPGDFVYLDPPYPRGLRGAPDPVAYQAGGFSDDEHRRVAALVRDLDRRGVQVMVSNSDCPLTRELFAGLRIDSLSVRRNVGGHSERRGDTRELVVRNYRDSRAGLSLLPGEDGEIGLPAPDHRW
jgi:DNA adenine methylase